MANVPGVFTAGDLQRGLPLALWANAEGRSYAQASIAQTGTESAHDSPIAAWLRRLCDL